MQTTLTRFTDVKHHLDGLVFWREYRVGRVEIKFIAGLRKHIPIEVLNYLISSF